MKTKLFIAGYWTKFLALLIGLLTTSHVWGETSTYTGTANANISGWTGSGTGTYTSGTKAVKFDTSGDSYTKTDIWSGDVSTGMTSISVTLNYKMNGAGDFSSNVFTVYAVNSSGQEKASATFAPTATSFTDKTVSLTITSGSGVTGLKLVYTTKDNGNVGVHSVSATATYSTTTTYTLIQVDME